MVRTGGGQLALTPPADGDRRRGADIIATQFVLISIATTLVCLRLYVRAKMVRKIGWDDRLIILALVSYNPARSSNISGGVESSILDGVDDGSS